MSLTVGDLTWIARVDEGPFRTGLTSLRTQLGRAGTQLARDGVGIGSGIGDSVTQAASRALGAQLQRTLSQRLTQASNALPDVVVDADTSPVDRGLADIRQRLTQLQGARIGVDVDAAQATQQLGELQADLRQVAAQHPDVQVRASAEQALRQLDGVRSAVRSLPEGTVDVVADTDGVREALRRLGEDTSEAEAAGRSVGSGVSGGVEDAVARLGTKAGPIVGSVIGALSVIASIAPGVMIWKAIQSGLEQEASRGLFTARTGLDPASVARFARAAGESYAQNFGESVDDNLEAARAALSTGLLGGASTQTEITDVTNKLQTVAQILGTEVPEVARAAGQAIRTGIARDATDAFDLITRAQQAGLNVSDDLLDTINEYGTQFRKVGLDGPAAFGLIAQAVRNGARDTDVAADAIKEFSIRSIDGSATSVAAYEAIGLSAEDMTRRIAAGGPDASVAMQQVFDAVRSVEDPAARSAAAVGLFGTQAEDLGAAIGAFDLSKARAEFGETGGVIDQAMADIGNNAAGQIETAKRSIEMASQGIQGALAAAFAPELGEAADWISTHRAEMTRYFLEVGSGALIAAETIATGVASGLEALSEFVGGFRGLGTAAIDASIVAAAAWKALPFTDDAEADRTIGHLKNLGVTYETSMDMVQEGSAAAADGIRTTLVPRIDDAQERFNAFGIPAVAQAAFTDATANLGAGLDDVSARAGETQSSLDRTTGAIDTSTESGRVLDGQLRTVAVSMLDQAAQGALLGQSQDELTGRFNAGRDALIEQLTQMGLTREQAEALTTSYGLVPGSVDTIVSDGGSADAIRGRVADLNAEIEKVKSREVRITAFLETVGSGSSAGRTSNGWTGGNTMATGGTVNGPGSGTSDDVPTWLSNGEEVIKERSARKHRQLLKAINRDDPGVPHFAGGGTVGDDLAVRISDPASFRAASGSAWETLMRVAQGAARSAAMAADEPGGGTAPAPSGGGSGWAWQVATIKKAFPNIAITSTTRPGAKTVSGNTSYHARGRAIDMSPRMDAFNWIAQNFPGTAELIYSPAGSRQLKNGRSHVYTGKVKDMHYNHVHWAFDQGGIARGRGFLPKDTPLPERMLSPRQTVAFERLVDVLTQQPPAGAREQATARPATTVSVSAVVSSVTDAALVGRQIGFELGKVA